jgi:hypothetical protein
MYFPDSFPPIILLIWVDLFFSSSSFHSSPSFFFSSSFDSEPCGFEVIQGSEKAVVRGITGIRIRGECLGLGVSEFRG